mmetsp:Transcript_36682/g.105616  ORF Transcript_36682/g.105616 Transcript_36682/m.105616 type:complete len:204 (+) Transcript_36682:691-1302(+)
MAFAMCVGDTSSGNARVMTRRPSLSGPKCTSTSLNNMKSSHAKMPSPRNCWLLTRPNSLVREIIAAKQKSEGRKGSPKMSHISGCWNESFSTGPVNLTQPYMHLARPSPLRKHNAFGSAQHCDNSQSSPVSAQRPRAPPEPSRQTLPKSPQQEPCAAQLALHWHERPGAKSPPQPLRPQASGSNDGWRAPSVVDVFAIVCPAS